jgi:hypothetical protein
MLTWSKHFGNGWRQLCLKPTTVATGKATLRCWPQSSHGWGATECARVPTISACKFIRVRSRGRHFLPAVKSGRLQLQLHCRYRVDTEGVPSRRGGSTPGPRGRIAGPQIIRSPRRWRPFPSSAWSKRAVAHYRNSHSQSGPALAVILRSRRLLGGGSRQAPTEARRRTDVMMKKEKDGRIPAAHELNSAI